MPHLVPMILSLVSLVFTVSCGGGSSTIVESPGGLRPALRYVEGLENAESRQQRLERLVELRGSQSTDLDWKGFWQLLNDSKVKTIILDELSDELLSLHGLDCRPTFYKSFVEFTLSNRLGAEYIVGPKNRCKVLLGPELSNKIIKTFLHSGLPIQDSREILWWLASEIDALPIRESWRFALDAEAIGLLRESSDRMLMNGEDDSVVTLHSSFNCALGWSPIQAVLQIHLMQGPLFGRIADRSSLEFLIESLAEAIRVAEYRQVRSRLEAMLEIKVSNSPGSPSEFLDKLTLLSSFVARMESTKTALLVFNQIQRALLKSVSLQSDRFRKELLELIASALALPSAATHQLTMAWLGIHLSESLSGWHRAWIANILSQDFSGIAPAFKILHKRTLLDLADDELKRRKLIREYCDLLAASGFPELALTPNSLTENQSEVGLGCLSLEVPDSKRVTFDSGLKLFPDSLIILPDRDLELVAREMYAGSFLAKRLTRSSNSNLPLRRLTIFSNSPVADRYLGFSQVTNEDYQKSEQE